MKWDDDCALIHQCVHVLIEFGFSGDDNIGHDLSHLMHCFIFCTYHHFLAEFAGHPVVRSGHTDILLFAIEADPCIHDKLSVGWV
jgi:hypothetical protein